MGDVLYRVAGALLTVAPLSAIVWYFWAHPDEWTRLKESIPEAFNATFFAAALLTLALPYSVNVFPDYKWHIMAGTGIVAVILLALGYWPFKRKR
jgi:hypothetical protein